MSGDMKIGLQRVVTPEALRDAPHLREIVNARMMAKIVRKAIQEGRPLTQSQIRELAPRWVFEPEHLDEYAIWWPARWIVRLVVVC